MLNREVNPMANVYSTYEAKARFSEVIRKVRAGQRVVIAYRGEEVAEIRPLENRGGSLAKAMARLEDQGVLGRRAKPAAPLRCLARKPGALKRFLESRE
jgi:prevent-host-death family protein